MEEVLLETKNVEEDCWISSTFQASLKKSDIYLWLKWSQLPKNEVTEVCICNKIWSWTAVQSLFSSAAFENVENPQMAYSEIYFSMILPSLEVWYRILNSLVVVTSHHLSIRRSFQWSTFIRWLLKMYNWSETIFHKSNSGWDHSRCHPNNLSRGNQGENPPPCDATNFCH